MFEVAKAGTTRWSAEGHNCDDAIPEETKNFIRGHIIFLSPKQHTGKIKDKS
jgi:hypothetical protein